MGILSTLINSIVGMAVVFAVLMLLMGCVFLTSKVMKKEASTKVALPEQKAAAPVLAKGSCGEVKLYDVPDKTAAMLMAITADKVGAPLNTLRFVSIKEVK